MRTVQCLSECSSTGLTIICLLASTAWGQVTLTVDADKVAGRIDPKVYGQFFEQIYHSANGGLWGEAIYNRSFEETDGTGVWETRNGTLVSGGGEEPGSRMYLGDTKWRDYEFTVDALLDGPGQLGIFCRITNTSSRAGDQNGYGLRLAGNTTLVRLRRRVPDEPMKTFDGVLESGVWHKVRVRCEGNRLRLWLDGNLAADFTDAKEPALAGRVGIGSVKARSQFRTPKVTSLDGTVLFQEMVSPARHWSFYGNGTAALSLDQPLNSKASLNLTGDNGESGVIQDALCLKRGDRVRGSLWMRGTTAQGMVLRLLEAGKVLMETPLPVPSAQWKECPFEFTPAETIRNAAIQIGVKGKSDVWLDQVSLMPDSARATGGFRADLLQAIAAIQPPVIRWPGGSFVSNYRWKDAIGPQSKRGSYPVNLWDDRDTNSLGTDEFIQLCRKVGAEPLIVINIGYRDEHVTRADYIQEALDWMEYCNGPADSKWGAVRKANGHPEPYNVKYWEIANETWNMGVGAYIQAIRDFVPPMRRKDPAVKIAVCGGSGTEPNSRGSWDETILQSDVAKLIDYLSIHWYEKPEAFAEGPWAAEKHYTYLRDIIRTSNNPRIRLYVSEWNAQTIDWRTGLYAGGLLNAFERQSDVLEIGGPALFVRHVAAPGWNNAFINFDQAGWFPAPNYVVMKLWREHYGPSLLGVKGGAGVLNIAAAKSETGDRVFLKAVNPGTGPLQVKLTLEGSRKPAHAAMQLVAPGGLNAQNSLDRPQTVSVAQGAASVDGRAVTFTMPALSAGVVTVELAR